MSGCTNISSQAQASSGSLWGGKGTLLEKAMKGRFWLFGTPNISLPLNFPCFSHSKQYFRPKLFFFLLHIIRTPGWRKSREGAKGIRRKVWTRTKNLSPNIHYFIALLRFVAIYVLFRTHKKCFFGAKKCYLGKKCIITCHILQIMLIKICKFEITRKNDAFVTKIWKTRHMYFCMAILLSPKGCQLLPLCRRQHMQA